MSISDSVPTKQESTKIGTILVLCSSIVFLLLMITCASVLFYVMNGYPVSIKKLSKIQQGMSPSDVRGILGEPKKKYGRTMDLWWSDLVLRCDSL